jgi:hypothetical protein
VVIFILDFFSFLPVFAGGGTLTLTLTPQALEYHRIFTLWNIIRIYLFWNIIELYLFSEGGPPWFLLLPEGLLLHLTSPLAALLLYFWLLLLLLLFLLC